MTYRPRGTQNDVISSAAPVIVVSGGAGTGKTTTSVAAARIHLQRADQRRQQLLRSAAIENQRTRIPAPGRALFLSFSRTAVTQILDRAGSVIGPYGPRLEVSTFHGFAWRIITSFGTHHGYPPPQTVLGSADAAVPGAPAGLIYDDLVPAARELLTVPAVAAHYAARYGMVICDEFQDTDADEWAFLRAIAPSARMLLLGDLHQCIYQGFKQVDPSARITDALALPGAVEIDLPATSFRDPTGALPAAAEAARDRRFDDPAIARAAAAGRLAVTRIPDGGGYDEVIRLTRQARRAGHTVNIFTHTNAATTDLSDALTQAGILHEQVGFGEAYGAAIAAQAALVAYGLGDDTAPLRRGIAVYITANLRRKSPLPPLIGQLLAATNPQLEHALGRLCADLRMAADHSENLMALADVVADGSHRVGQTRGQETWTRAAHRTRAVLGTASRPDAPKITAALGRIRDDALVGGLTPRQHSVQVMNLHQTKGREADTTILLLNPDEWHGDEREPFPQGSRLLYVVMTRARHTAHLVTAGVTHPLWRPLVETCTEAAAISSTDDPSD